MANNDSNQPRGPMIPFFALAPEPRQSIVKQMAYGGSTSKALAYGGSGVANGADPGHDFRIARGRTFLRAGRPVVAIPQFGGVRIPVTSTSQAGAGSQTSASGITLSTAPGVTAARQVSGPSRLGPRYNIY